MPGHLEFDFGFGRSGRPRDEDEPMRLLVLGDFSGKPAAERPPLATRPIARVDVDTLDDVMKRLAPRLTRAGRRNPVCATRRFSSRPVVHPAGAVPGAA